MKVKEFYFTTETYNSFIAHDYSWDYPITTYEDFSTTLGDKWFF